MTDILKIVDIMPDEAKHLAQKLHRKKDEIEIYRKALIGEVEDSADMERTIVARVSTNDRDRDGEVVEPNGIDLKDFQANPVLCWAHRYDIPPVGKALWSKTDENGLVCKFQFAQTQFAEDIYSLYKGGYLRAFSIGFIPTDYDTKTKTHNRISLLEVSCVPVPANQSALVMDAYAKGIVTSEALKKDLGFAEAEPIAEPAVEPVEEKAEIVQTPATVTMSGTDTADVTTDTAKLEDAEAFADVAGDDTVLELSIPELDHIRTSVENLAIQMNTLIKDIEAMRDIIDGRMPIEKWVDVGDGIAVPASALDVLRTEPATSDEARPCKSEPAGSTPAAGSTITITKAPKSDAEDVLEFLRSKEFTERIQLMVDKAIGRVR